MTVGLLMGVYNEAHRMPECLDHHLKYVDDAAIVIQQSDDGTEEVVHAYLLDHGYTKTDYIAERDIYTQRDKPTVRVLHFPKMGCSEATLQDGVNALTSDWVLYVDADEKFPEDFLRRMHDATNTTKYDGFRFERDNYFNVPVFNQAVPIEPKSLIVKHPMRDQQVRLTRKSRSIFPRQIHVRARVRDENGIEHIYSLDDTIYHLKDIQEQWTDNNQYLPDVRIVEAMEKTKHDQLIDIPRADSNANGMLFFAEEIKQIPFQTKRVFWVFANSQAIRGGHANMKVHEVLVCLQGSVKVTLNNGQRVNEFILDNAGQGVFIKNKTWIEMTEFSDDTILLCMASEIYDEKDYIRTFEAFGEAIK